MDVEVVTERIIGAAMEVSTVLGPGFLERVYRRALGEELRIRGVAVEEEVHFRIGYKQRCVGEYVADMVVDGQVIVELKCAEFITNEHVAQTLNYLKAADLTVGLILNFQRPRLQWKRVVMNYEPALKCSPPMDADGRR
ncbi:MAG TPA: GxxExxY protein [Bryobacteraceae bacterium]|nr:GxxExxY protein [Bryobacteraceae bacterium]